MVDDPADPPVVDPSAANVWTQVVLPTAKTWTGVILPQTLSVPIPVDQIPIWEAS